eukprot:scaffold298_cov247-Pinguiococcus_pyrenoidosus.AAC.33
MAKAAGRRVGLAGTRPAMPRYGYCSMAAQERRSGGSSCVSRVIAKCRELQLRKARQMLFRTPGGQSHAGRYCDRSTSRRNALAPSSGTLAVLPQPSAEVAKHPLAGIGCTVCQVAGTTNPFDFSRAPSRTNPSSAPGPALRRFVLPRRLQRRRARRPEPASPQRVRGARAHSHERPPLPQRPGGAAAGGGVAAGHLQRQRRAGRHQDGVHHHGAGKSRQLPGDAGPAAPRAGRRRRLHHQASQSAGQAREPEPQVSLPAAALASRAARLLRPAPHGRGGADSGALQQAEGEHHAGEPALAADVPPWGGRLGGRPAVSEGPRRALLDRLSLARAPGLAAGAGCARLRPRELLRAALVSVANW